MTELLGSLAQRRGEDPALIDESGVTTWAELDERANRIINGLRALGLKDHDTVAVMSGNQREFFEIFVAAMQANWVVVPVNWHWVAEELAYVLGNSGARALFVDERYREVASAARSDERTSSCEHWIVFGDAQLDATTPASAAGADAEIDAEGFEPFESLIAGASAEEPAGQGTGGPMFYTSGTTGFPKGVRTSLCKTGLPVEMWSLIAGSFTQMLSLPADGVTLLDGPAYHSAQWVFSVFPLLCGSTIVMRHKFDPHKTLRAIDEHRVTNVHLVPTQFIRLLKLDEATRSSFSGASLETVYHGAAPCPGEVKRSMLTWWGNVVSEYYGGTEGGFLTTISGDEWLERPGSLGRSTDLVELRIVDDDYQEVPAGTSGQIYFRSVIGSDFEYHDDPEKTSAAHLSDGWGTLGDIGYFDDDGYLFMSDRRIDMIISGGVNIYPAEIEAVLVDHELVNDAAVFGIPDDEMGERVMAVVELVNPEDASEDLSEELMAFCRERLAGYKAPRVVGFADKLPRQPTGKLYKRLLRDPFWEGVGRSI